VNAAISIPAPIEEVVMQALEKERENRFSSATAFLTALDEAEAEEPFQPDPAPPVSAARSPRRRYLGFGAAAVVVLLGLGFGLLPRHSSGPKTVATARVPRPTPPPAELAARIRVIEDLLGAGESVKARVALEQVLAENPRNGRVRYLLGRLAFADDHHAEALGDYREAMALDPGFRADPLLIDHLGVALGEPKVADAALDLAIERVGRPAADLLERVANTGGDLRRRQRAARALTELGEASRVDAVSLHIAELKKSTTCEDKKPIVLALGNLEDPRALPILRAQRSRGGIEGLFGGEPNTTCMKTELAEAIAKLEAKLPSEKRPSSHPPVHRSIARPSIFRGR
jgi:hypothetical protein